MRFSWRNLITWSLFDAGNSIIVVNVYLYFSQWLVIDRGVPSLFYNLLFVGSTALLLLSAPMLGMSADRRGVRLPYLYGTSVLMFGGYIGAGLIAIVAPEWPRSAALLALLGNYGYQLSLVFYNPLLTSVAIKERHGLASGIGQASNWSGQIIGILLTLPIASGALHLLDAPPRVQAILLATITGSALMLPMLLLFREHRSEPVISNQSGSSRWLASYRQFIPLCLTPGIAWCLVGMILTNEGLTTSTENFPLFLAHVWQLSDGMKALLLLMILMTSAVGALIAGWISDRIGARRCFLWTVGCWIICIPLVGIASPLPVFIICCTALGLLFGATWTVSRTVLLELLPPAMQTYGMSFYAIFERNSSFIGPILWGSIITGLSIDIAARYRLALSAMAILAFGGFLCLRRMQRSLG